MTPHIRHILALGGLLALPCPILAQTMPAPTIIACEGPNMPSACPRTSDAARSQAVERSMVAKRADVTALQAQQMIWQRQALVRGVTPTPARPAAPPVYQTFQPNPYLAPLAPPDFKSAAQVLGNLAGGGPHN
jgi:hypothetical protein